ncbi:MAG: hypothetical protein ACP6IS_08420 [Candidatus Asgardarchaeia archaeon]
MKDITVLKLILYFIACPIVVLVAIYGLFYFFIILISCVATVTLIQRFLKGNKNAWYVLTVISCYSLIARAIFFIIYFLGIQELLSLLNINLVGTSTFLSSITLSPLSFAYLFVSKTFNITINTPNPALGLFSFGIFIILVMFLYYPPIPSTAISFILLFLLPHIASIVFPTIMYPLLLAFDTVYIYLLFRYRMLSH